MTRVRVDVPSMTFRLPPGTSVSADALGVAFRARLEEILVEHASELAAAAERDSELAATDERPGPQLDRSTLESVVTRAVAAALAEAAQ